MYTRTLVTLTFLVSSTSIFAQDKVRERLDKAITTYDSKAEDIKRQIDEHFESREKLARNRNNNDELKKIESERDAFATSRVMPESCPDAILKKNESARNAMLNEFKIARKSYFKSKQDNEVELIDKEAKLFEELSIKSPDRFPQGSKWKGPRSGFDTNAKRPIPNNGDPVEATIVNRTDSTIELQIEIRPQFSDTVYLTERQGVWTIEKIIQQPPDGRPSVQLNIQKGNVTIGRNSLNISFLHPAGNGHISMNYDLKRPKQGL